MFTFPNHAAPQPIAFPPTDERPRSKSGARSGSRNSHGGGPSAKKAKVPKAPVELRPAAGPPVLLRATASAEDVSSRRQHFALTPANDAESVVFSVATKLPAEVDSLEAPVMMRLVQTRPTNNEVLQVYHIFDGSALWGWDGGGGGRTIASLRRARCPVDARRERLYRSRAPHPSSAFPANP